MGHPQREENQWLFRDASESAQQREDLERERRKLAEERRQFEAEKREFQMRQRLEEQRRTQQNHLFEMKWKILEEELQKLAAEKQRLEIEKEQYSYHQQESFGAASMIHGEMFFSGVDNELGMRKRYKDLIKIYHPDNLNGDKATLQAINQEYDELKKQFCG